MLLLMYRADSDRSDPPMLQNALAVSDEMATTWHCAELARPALTHDLVHRNLKRKTSIR